MKKFFAIFFLGLLLSGFLFSGYVFSQQQEIDVSFNDLSEDRRFCQLYSAFANPIFAIGLVIVIVGIVGAGIFLLTPQGDAGKVTTARKLIVKLILAFIVLLVVTKLPQSIYNLATAGKFQSGCF